MELLHMFYDIGSIYIPPSSMNTSNDNCALMEGMMYSYTEIPVN